MTQETVTAKRWKVRYKKIRDGGEYYSCFIVKSKSPISEQSVRESNLVANVVGNNEIDDISPYEGIV